MRSHYGLSIVQKIDHGPSRVVRTASHITGCLVKRVLVVWYYASVGLKARLSRDYANWAYWVGERAKLSSDCCVCYSSLLTSSTHSLLAPGASSHHISRCLGRVKDQLGWPSVDPMSSSAAIASKVAVFYSDSPALIILLLLLSLFSSPDF